MASRTIIGHSGVLVTSARSGLSLSPLLATVALLVGMLLAGVAEARAKDATLASCIDTACDKQKKEEKSDILAFIDDVTKCYGSLTPEELSSAIDYFLNHCVAPPPSTQPGNPCLGLTELLEANTTYTCAQKNAVLKWHKCPYRFNCGDKDVPPPTIPPCAECPDYGIEPPPFPPVRNVGWPNLGLLDNPQGQPLSRPPQMAGVDLSNGAVERTVVDLSLPSVGFSWTIGRSYSARQLDNTGAHRDVDNYQGWNWVQTSQPHLYHHTTSELGGVIGRLNLVMDGQTTLTFIETGAGSNVFKARGSGAGVMYKVSGSPATWVYHDQNGNTMTFIDIASGTFAKSKPLWKIEDAAGNVAYVGSNASASAALSAGYDSDQHILIAYDTNGRVYTYTYSGSAIGSIKRLLSVVVTLSAVEVGRVEYYYYGDTTTGGFNDPKDISGGSATGLAGDLKLVRVTLPTSVTAQTIATKTHYRYYVNDSTTSVDLKGYKHTLKHIVNPEGVRRYELASGAITATTAYDATINNFASEFMDYHQPTGSGFNPARYVRSKFNNGECGCGGGSLNGTYTFAYSWYTGIDEWVITPAAYGANAAFRADVTQPDGIHLYQYTDVQGLSTGSAIADLTNSKYWLTKVARNTTTGFTSAIYSPTAVDNAGGGTNLSTGAMDVNSSGLVQHFDYFVGGTLDGFLRHSKISNDNGATKTLVSTTEYLARTTTLTVNSVNVTLRRPFTQYSWVYDTAQTTEADSSVPTVPSGSHRTATDYDFWSNTQTDTLSLVPISIQTTLPRVALTDNGRGDGSSDPFVYSMTYLRKDGTPAFMRELAFDDRVQPVYSYTKYSGGLMTERVVDVQSGDSDIVAGDATATSAGVGIIFVIPDMASSGTGLLTQKTLYEYDNQGRSTDTKLYAQMSSGDQRWMKNYYTRLDDGRPVVLSIPKYTSTTPTYYGPVGYSVTNHGGRSEFSGTIGFGSSAPYTTTTLISTWINSSSANPITAVAGSGLSLSQCSATLYDNAGVKPSAQRMYTNLTTPSYDESTFIYDDMGRLIRTLDPTSTINRTAFDSIGRVIEHSVGTDDTGAPKSPMSGTSNMYTTDTTYYDGATTSTLVDGGNSYLTRRTLHVTNSSGDDRTTDYLYDFRGRAVVVNGPVSPYSVTLYDNRRAIAAGSYSSTSGLSASTDPTSNATNRLSLSESFFDARGQGWRQVQWEINQGTGAKAASGTQFLESRSVFGAAGEILQSRGSDAHRLNYDRLRRRTHDWTLAYTNAWDGTNNHESYDDIFDATTNTTLLSSNSSTGDVVLQEGRASYDNDRNRLEVTAVISRHHDDDIAHFSSTTVTRGPLDGTSGTSPLFDVSAISGRLHGITASYYDELDRPTTSAAYGDNRDTTAIFDYSYNTTAPTASSAASSGVAAVLVSINDYDKFGRVERVHDPKNLKTEYTFDDAGRMTKTRANAVGSPGQDTVDTYFTYSNGLRTEMWVDANLNGSYSSGTDQKTTYAYANNSTPGSGNPGSIMTVNNLLTSVTYPDTGVVKYGYNAQGQQREMKDQSGNFTAFTYDLGGRETLRAFTTIAGGFDATLKSVATTYGDPRGLPTQIAQYNSTSTFNSSTLLDSVDFAYDDAGNLKGRTQTVDTYSWDSTFKCDLHSPNGTTLLRSTYALTEIGYPDVVSSNRTLVDYSYVSSGSWDLAAERVSTVSVNRVDDGLGTFTALSSYTYNGQAELMEQRAYFTTATGITERSLAQSPDDLNPASYRTYPNLDAFDRVTKSSLQRITVTTTPTTSYARFYKVSTLTGAGAAGYDDNSNIIGLADDRWALYSADFTVDGMNRLTQRTKTTGSGVDGMNESFGMDRLGNFIGSCTGTPVPGILTDFNGNGTIAGSDTSETRTANISNQITGRTFGCTGSPVAPGYDLVGNLTSDDTTGSSTYGYTYLWDAMGRLTTVTSQQTGLVVAEYRYSADNHRIAWRYNGSANPWFYPVYDHRWRMIALYKQETSGPPSLQERFYYHNAGLAGSGGSQYIDSVIARDDTPVSGNLTRYMFHAQNWRGDVVGMFQGNGLPYEHIRYTAYGRPIAMTASDWDGDGTYEVGDFSAFVAAYGGPNTDFNLDGVITSQDLFDFNTDWFAHGSAGIDKLASGSANRKGYAGYEHDPVVPNLQLARHRYYRSDFAMWMRKDPAFDLFAVNLYQYSEDAPLTGVDEMGLMMAATCTSGCGGGLSTINPSTTQPFQTPWQSPAVSPLPIRRPSPQTKSFCQIWAERIANHQPNLKPQCRKVLIGELMRVCNGGDMDPRDRSTRKTISELAACAAYCTFNAMMPQRLNNCYEGCVGDSYQACASMVGQIPGCSMFLPGSTGGGLGFLGIVDALCVTFCSLAPNIKLRAECIAGCIVPIGAAAVACQTAMLGCMASYAEDCQVVCFNEGQRFVNPDWLRWKNCKSKYKFPGPLDTPY